MNLLKENAIILQEKSSDYDELLEAIGDASIVCIGDGSHGTFEFYRERAKITRRLIQEKGFHVIALEADWPDCVSVNQKIHEKSKEKPFDALDAFERFPQWMWKNDVVQEFLEWLKQWNSTTKEPQVDVYGLVRVFQLIRRNFMYNIGHVQASVVMATKFNAPSLQRSAEAVIKYLESSSNEHAATSAKHLYECFDRFNDDPMVYSMSVHFGLDKGCREESIKVLRQLSEKSASIEEQKDQFIAEMNALVVKDAEEYYRCMLNEDIQSWNIRDHHMLKTLYRIMQHTSKINHQPCKVIVWAHNSHVGNAKFTDMGIRRGEVNIGQLCHEQFESMGVFCIGCIGHEGTVYAAHEWDGVGQCMTVLPSRHDSIEHVFHEQFMNRNVLMIFNAMQGKSKILHPKLNLKVYEFLAESRLQRFIGVIYKPQTERWSHYSFASLSKQFDAIVFMDKTRAIHPVAYTMEKEA